MTSQQKNLENRLKVNKSVITWYCKKCSKVKRHFIDNLKRTVEKSDWMDMTQDLMLPDATTKSAKETQRSALNTLLDNIDETIDTQH